jgi:putative membrane protein
MKTVWLAYALAALVLIAGFWLYYEYGQNQPAWLMAIPLLAFLPAVRMQLKRRLTSLRLVDDHLILENGFLSRMQRTVDTAKIQDVTVKQTLGQRILGVGDLRLESAGEAGSMAIANLDRPYQIADAIIKSARRSPGAASLKPF